MEFLVWQVEQYSSIKKYLDFQSSFCWYQSVKNRKNSIKVQRKYKIPLPINVPPNRYFFSCQLRSICFTSCFFTQLLIQHCPCSFVFLSVFFCLIICLSLCLTGDYQYFCRSVCLDIFISMLYNFFGEASSVFSIFLRPVKGLLCLKSERIRFCGIFFCT